MLVDCVLQTQMHSKVIEKTDVLFISVKFSRNDFSRLFRHFAFPNVLNRLICIMMAAFVEGRGEFHTKI